MSKQVVRPYSLRWWCITLSVRTDYFHTLTFFAVRQRKKLCKFSVPLIFRCVNTNICLHKRLKWCIFNWLSVPLEFVNNFRSICFTAMPNAIIKIMSKTSLISKRIHRLPIRKFTVNGFLCKFPNNLNACEWFWLRCQIHLFVLSGSMVNWNHLIACCHDFSLRRQIFSHSHFSDSFDSMTWHLQSTQLVWLFFFRVMEKIP